MPFKFCDNPRLHRTIQTGLDIIGAIIFPAGFVMILLLNLELVTGSFAIMPLAKFRDKTTTSLVIRNLTLAFIGNLLGGLFYAVLYTISITKFGHVTDSLMIEKIIAVAEAKTLGYKANGMDGMIVLFVNAILCNWMVTTGVVMNFTSKSTIGKIAAMWLPIFIFFAQGFEHSVVNMFVIPAGMMLGADISFLIGGYGIKFQSLSEIFKWYAIHWSSFTFITKPKKIDSNT